MNLKYLHCIQFHAWASLLIKVEAAKIFNSSNPTEGDEVFNPNKVRMYIVTQTWSFIHLTKLRNWIVFLWQVSTDRTQSHGWLFEGDNEKLQALSKHLDHVSGLQVSFVRPSETYSSFEESEDYQVGLELKKSWFKENTCLFWIDWCLWTRWTLLGSPGFPDCGCNSKMKHDIFITYINLNCLPFSEMEWWHLCGG